MILSQFGTLQFRKLFFSIWTSRPFSVFFKYAPKGKKLGKSSISTYIVVSLMLTLLNQTVILVLNPEVAGLTTYPLLTVVQMIYAAQIFERADAFFTLILFIGLDVNHVHLFIGYHRDAKTHYN